MAKLVFEDVTNNTSSDIKRARIPMGWIVEESTVVSHMLFNAKYGGNGPDGYDWRISITFVFDPLHLWK